MSKKAVIKQKEAFREGNFLELNKLKKEIRSDIRRAKQGYKEKIETLVEEIYYNRVKQVLLEV